MTDKREDQWSARDLLMVFNDYDTLNKKGGEWSISDISFCVRCESGKLIFVEFTLYKEPVSELFDGVRELPENTVAEYSVVVFVGDEYNEVGLIYQTDDGQFILDDDCDKRWADLSDKYSSIPELNDITVRIQQEMKTEKMRSVAYENPIKEVKKGEIIDDFADRCIEYPICVSNDFLSQLITQDKDNNQNLTLEEYQKLSQNQVCIGFFPDGDVILMYDHSFRRETDRTLNNLFFNLTQQQKIELEDDFYDVHSYETVRKDLEQLDKEKSKSEIEKESTKTNEMER